MLLNQVLSANRVSPGDEKVAQWALLGAATLSLGLETVARGDVTRGVEAMRTVALSRLHRVGYSVTLQLGKLARTLGPLAARSDEPFVEVVAGLRQLRPHVSRLLDIPAGESFRPFAEVADVRKTADALAVLAAQIICVRDLLGVEPPGVRTLGDVGRTAVAHALLGETPSAAPLAAGRLATLPDGDPLPAFLALAEQKKIVLPPEFPRVISGWKTELDAKPVDQNGLLIE